MNRAATHANPADTYLTIESAADRLACSKDTVRRMIARGQLKAYRAGHLIRIQHRDLERALKPVTNYQGGGRVA